MPEPLALIYWIKDSKTGIVPVESVLEENRSPGQIGPVKWTDGHTYPAQIIKISKCILTLEKAEVAFVKKMEALKGKEGKESAESSDQSKGVRTSRRPPKKTTAVVPAGTASDVQVSKALGEKIKLNPKLSAEKLEQQRKDKEAKVESDKTQRALDEVVLRSKQPIVANSTNAVRRNLNTVLAVVESPEKREKSVSPDSLFSHGNQADDSHPGANESVIVQSHSSDDDTEGDEDGRETCNRCRALSIAVHRGTVSEFVTSLSKFCYLPPEAVPEMKMEIIGDEVVRFLKPLPVTPGHKKVEVTVGSGLFIKKAKKSQLVVDAGNDPYKLTRLTLVSLFGDQLRSKGISAKAKGSEKLGIEEADLTNIFNFVCRNSNVQAPPKDQKPFNYSTFIREVNRKFKSCSRDRTKSRKSVGKTNLSMTPKKQTTPKKNVAVHQNTSAAVVEGATESQSSTRLTSAGTPKKNWEVTTTLEDFGRHNSFYYDSHQRSNYNSNALTFPYDQSAGYYSGIPSSSGYHAAPSTSSYQPPFTGFNSAAPHSSGHFQQQPNVFYPGVAPSGNDFESEPSALLDTDTLLSL